MESKKLDRLFREKAEQLELSPSAAAWEQISNQTNKGKTFGVLWKVAAAVIAIASVSLVVWKQADTALQYALMDHPVQPALGEEMALHSFEIPFEETTIDPQLPAPVDNVVEGATMLAQEENTTSTEDLVELPTEMPVLSLSPRTGLAQLEQPTMPEVIALPDTEPIVNEEPAVIIKYYADNLTEQPSDDDRKGIGNLWAKAQSFKPGEFLADLRTAKDDLLRSKRLN